MTNQLTIGTHRVSDFIPNLARFALLVTGATSGAACGARVTWLRAEVTPHASSGSKLAW